ncbi:MAG TPA: tetratricopeptide repeat protein [Vicinamibacterales bacterium]|nr:tetratricopeptide repeat protein [Vicinamibacterales bacterium]
MAKLRRSAARPSPAKKSNAAKPAARPKARPAVKKPAPKPAPKPAAKKPAAPKAADKVRKPAARPAPKPAPKPVPKAEPKPAPKPKPAPPPRRSTYADAVLLYERGLHALQAKRYRDAADTLRRVIAEFPEEIELHERAQLYIRVCERQLAPPDDTPKTPEEQVYAATLALNSGAVDRAVSLLNAVLQRHVDNDAAEYMLGVAMATRGDQQGAIRHLARALELNPDCRDSLRKEPELESLRETPELRALLAAASRRDRRPKGTRR